MKNEDDFPCIIKGVLLGLALAMIMILMSIMITGCEKPETYEKQLIVSVAYPPFACDKLEPTLLRMKVEGEWIDLKITEVSGGFVTEHFALPFGENDVQEAIAYNASGEETHKVLSIKTLGGMQGIGVPFTLRVNEKTPWVQLQMFCEQWNGS